MCYNPEVSIGTFLFVGLLSAYLWIRDKGIDKALALILTTIALMQLLEWGLWLTPGICSTLNKVITAAIPVYLVLQPVAINWIVGTYNAGWAPYYKEISAITALLLVPYYAYKSYENYGACSTLDANNNLVWGGTPLKKPRAYLYYTAMVYPLITLKNPTFSGLYIFFSTLSHWLFKNKNKDSWKSLWCHFVNALAVFAVIRPGV